MHVNFRGAILIDAHVVLAANGQPLSSVAEGKFDACGYA
jgi:hypothetical protein